MDSMVVLQYMVKVFISNMNSYLGVRIIKVEYVDEIKWKFITHGSISISAGFHVRISFDDV